MTRSARKIAEATESYRTDAPADVRRGFEDGIKGALELLASKAALPRRTQDLFLDALISLIVDYVSGGWGKVRRALELGNPELYKALKDHLPSDAGGIPLA